MAAVKRATKKATPVKKVAPRRKAAAKKAVAPRSARRPIETLPDKRQVTTRQAAYLAEISGLDQEKLVGREISELGTLLEWRIDPFLLFFRKVCGRVVRTDPVTGIVHGVPGATVHIMDTDCSFLGFFPVEDPAWWWLWLINCQEEEIATTSTDECGNFCVWVPRWDIDRLLRWRRERICFPDVFRPNLGDLFALIERPIPKRPVPPRPGAGPDPVPDREVLLRVGEFVPQSVVQRLMTASGEDRFGAASATAELFELPAFGSGDFPPPVSPQALERLDALRYEKVPHPREIRPIGPFIRCRDIFVPEWTTVFDVPDISFKVTQDVDLDGDEEVIYDEGLFDVRWNIGPIPNVVLEAWPGARVSEICDGPDIPCVNTPTIETVGLMPLQPSHHNATGYSTRVNRPHPGGLTGSPPAAGESARSPYAGTLQLHGCHHITGASYYRLLYRYRPTLADPLAGEVPFTALSWWAPRIGMGPTHVVPDADGWYPILATSDMVFPHWVLNWPSTDSPNGQYEVRLQVGSAAKAPMAASATVAFMVDNRAPNAGFSLMRWRVSPSGGWTTLPMTCPVINRPANSSIELEVNWFANAAHFRDAVLSAGGCGGASPVRIDGPPPPLQPGSPADFDHWHIDQFDNSMVNVGTFLIPGIAAAGCYTVSIDAHSRGFNPAGDGGGPGVNWLADYAYRHAHPSIAISVVDV
jgi:hypothetical protein